MKLHRIQVINFKGVTQQEIEFPSQGVTVLEGQNESGKSSVIQALDLLLEERHTAKTKATRAARPEGRDVGVSVEAELTLDGQRLLYRKRWWKEAGAELQFLAGPRSGHSLTGREAHDAVTELMNRSDPALWRALRLLQTGQHSQDFKASAGLRRALEAGGTAVDDDSAALTVLEAARLERSKYFTDTGKEKTETTALRRDHQDALIGHQSAQAALDTIARAVDSYDRAVAEATTARDTLARARQDLADAEAAATAVHTLQAERQQAQQAHQHATSHAQGAAQDHQERTRLVQEVQASQLQRDQLEASVAQRQLTTQASQDAAHHARSALTQARGELRLARTTDRDAQAAERRAADMSRLADLTAVVAQLDELQSEGAALATQQVTAITAEQVESLETAQRAVELAQSQLDAGSAQLTVSALAPGVQVEWDGTTTALDPDQSRQQPVTEPVTLELAHQLRIVVEPEDGLQQRQAKVRTAQDTLDSLLATTDVDSVQHAREALRLAQQHATHRESLDERKALILRGRTEHAVREETSALAAALEAAGATGVSASSAAGAAAESEHRPTADQLRAAVEAASAQLESAQDATARCEQALQQSEAQEHKDQLALTQVRTELANSEQVHTSALDRLSEARSMISDDDLVQARSEADQHLTEATANLERLNAAWTSSDADNVLQLARGSRTRVDNAQKRLDEARAQQSRAEGTLEGLNRDAVQREYDSTRTRVLTSAEELTTHLRRAAAAKLLADTLERHQAEAHRRYNAPFRRQLELLGQRVFGSTFQVELSDDLTVTRRHLHGTWLEVDALSTGAQEQLEVLVRLAIASLVDPEDGVPVVLDDTLGHTDPRRLISLAGALETVGSSAQVIVLTATPDRFGALSAAKTVRIQESP